MKTIKTNNSIMFEFTNEELLVLADSLLDPLAHFEIVATEKLANCQQRLFAEWTGKLRQEKRVEAIPTDDKSLMDLILLQPDYKNRVDRDKADLSLRMAG